MGVVQGNTGIGAVISTSVTGGSGRTEHAVLGVKAGDRVTMAMDVTYMPSSDATASFETAASQDGILIQTSGDLNGHTIGLVLTRPT